MRFPSACASGFEAWGTFEAWRPFEAWGPGLEDAEVFATAAFGIVQRRTELREARGASRGNAVCGSKTRFPSACASGFEAWGLGLEDAEVFATAEFGIVQSRHRTPRSLSREPRGYGLWIKNAGSLSLRFGLRSMGGLGWKMRRFSRLLRLDLCNDELNSGKPEPRAEGMRSVDQKRWFSQLALRASKHGP
jgi:hypothetical protein